ncbi:MAG: T9SS type A sorting domain-containing protein [Bacteroidia bacterium]|nr:T9SS type A sorting domain-containing protein [Bacteroidia bacterium]
MAFDRMENAYFGTSVDLQNSRLIVGAPRSNFDTSQGNTVIEAGAAYIYELDTTGNYSSVSKIGAHDASSADSYGIAVGIFEKTAIVGSFNDDTDINGSNFLNGAGSAYIYELDSANGSWIQTQKIVPSDREAGANFGWRVAIDDGTIIVSAPEESKDSIGLNPINNSGAIYIYNKDSSGTWSEKQKITAFDREQGDFFGESISIHDDGIIVGAFGDNEDENGNNTLISSGSAYIFKKSSDTTWSFQQKIAASDRAVADKFGNGVSIYKNTLVVAASQEDEDSNGLNTLSGSGSIYIFQKDSNGIWQETQKLTASDRLSLANFGFSVSLDERFLSVGAHKMTVDTGVTPFSAGATYIFRRDSLGTYTEESKVYGSDPTLDDEFGYSVAVDSSLIAVGAWSQPLDSASQNFLNETGAVYLFRYDQSVGIVDLMQGLKGLLAYPNPTNSEFHINLGQKFRQLRMTIFNSEGRLISEQQFLNTAVITSQWNAPSGLYFIQVYSENKYLGSSKIVFSK